MTIDKKKIREVLKEHFKAAPWHYGEPADLKKNLKAAGFYTLPIGERAELMADVQAEVKTSKTNV